MLDIDNQNNESFSATEEPFNNNEEQIQTLQNDEENNNENNENLLNKQIADIINQKLVEFQSQITGTITSLQENAKTLGDKNKKLEIEKLLSESKILDGRFYDFVYADNLDLVKSKIEELENLINQILIERVDLIVNERLGQSSWIPGSNSNFSSSNNFKKPAYMV